MFDFSRGTVTLVVVPVDMRCGFDKLAYIAYTLLGIDVRAGGQFVVFVSKSFKICKVISCDEHGSTMVVRKLNAGTFERFLMREEGPGCTNLTAGELEKFLNGQSILVRRSSFLRG